MVELSEKARENKVRRHAAKEGLYIRKSRQRIFNSLDHGYLIVNENNWIQSGEGYCLDLEDLERFFNCK